MQPDYYALLEVDPAASLQHIRKNYRRLALRWHPDHARETEAPERFRAITEAYEVLRSPERRRAYDEMRQIRRRAPGPVRPKGAAKVGRDALNWVEEFFIQAGGIEAEGPGKGSLRRFSARDLEEIWSFIAGRLALRGEVRLSIRQLELVRHYVRKHPELGFPARGEERLLEKERVLAELESLRKGIHQSWDAMPVAMEDLLRKRQFEDARSLLLWRAAHEAADELARSSLFAAAPGVRVPSRELAMIDRLESIATGEPAEHRLGHGYLACRRCGAWAMEWGVAVPRCAYCRSRRMKLRARDERDEWLSRLIGRRPPFFWAQANLYWRARQQGVERWIWGPAFTFAAMLAVFAAWGAGDPGLDWLAVLSFATGWFWGAWAEDDNVPADTDVLYPDEWEVTRAIGGGFRWVALTVLIVFAILNGVDGRWLAFLATSIGAFLVAYRPLAASLVAGDGGTRGGEGESG